MQTFTGYEYLLIDIANYFGLDKDLFEDRITWVKAHMDCLETKVNEADDPDLYIKAVMTLRKVMKGEATGTTVAFDACCSGLQIMATLTGCIDGATNTGLVDPNVRADAYSKCTEFMCDELKGEVLVSRKEAKQAVMTTLYGSKAEPRQLFGEDSPQLNAFYVAIQKLSPGAWELLQDLLDSWQPYSLQHCWKLPDGFDVKVKVMQQKQTRIEVDELDHATFTYQYYDNEGSKKGLSNVANVVHSIDAYVVRTIQRRCNYDEVMLDIAMSNIQFELKARKNACKEIPLFSINTKVQYYIDQYNRSGMPDAAIFPYLIDGQAMLLSTKHLEALYTIGSSMLVHEPFEVITVHDAFHCSPNNMNYLRQHYINIFAEMAESEILSDILSQIHGSQGKYKKLSNNLGTLIRGSNYALS